MDPASHGVEVWHEAVAQLVVVDERLVAGMVVGSKVPDFTCRPLAMDTEQGDEGTELAPAGLQLAPLLEVFVLYAALLEQFLCCHVAVLNAEATLVHAPEGQTGHRIVQTGSHLGTHVLPTGTDVARPCGGAVTLLAGKAATGQQEDALVGGDTALTIVDGIGIDDAVGIEILRSRTKSRGTAECLAIPHGGAVADIGLRGIHPPGIDTILILREEVVVHLFPEQLAGTGIVGIVERADIARAYPVVDIVRDGLMVHPALGIDFLVVVGIAVELGPDGNHEAATHLVYLVEHSLRIGIARGFKLVGAPLILLPVVPVLNDVVARNLALAELRQRADNLVGRLITLTALPEAQHPLGIDGSLACQRTVAADDLVGIAAGNEVIVHVLGHLAPDAELVLILTNLLGDTQTAIADTAVRLPLDAQLGTASLLEQGHELIGIGVPGRTPTLGHHLLTVDIHLDIAGIVEDEMVDAAGRSLNEALVGDRGAIELEVLRQVLDAAGLGAIGQFRGGGTVELVVDGVLVAHQLLAVLVDIGTGQTAFLAMLVEELEGATQLQVVVGIAKTAVAVRVPQNTVVAVGEHKGYADLGVILEEVFVAALHVQLLRLMLAETIEGLVVVLVEQQTPRQTILLGLGYLGNVDTDFTIGDTVGLERLTILGLAQNLTTLGVVERHTTRLPLNTGFHVLGLDADHAAVLDRKLRLGSLVDHYQTLLLGQLRLRRGLHTDNVVVDYLQTDHTRAVGLDLSDGNGYLLAVDHVVGSHQQDGCHGQRTRHDCS